MIDWLLAHDWTLPWLALGTVLGTLALIGYLLARRTRTHRLDPKTLPPMSAEWQSSRDRYKRR